MSKFLGMLCGECGSYTFIKDSAPRVIRRVVVRDSANDDELVRYAKAHDDWEVYDRPRGKKGIRLSLDNSHYAAISAIEGKDAEYEVRFRGFSDAIDTENTRNYTDLERAVHFAYARGKDLLEKESVNDGRGSKRGCGVRRENIKDVRRSRVNRHVKDDDYGTTLTAEGAMKLMKNYSSLTDIDRDGEFIFADWDLVARAEEDANVGGVTVWVRCDGDDDDALVTEYGVTFLDAGNVPYGEYKENAGAYATNLDILLGILEKSDDQHDLENRLEYYADEYSRGIFRVEDVCKKKAPRHVRVARDSRGRLMHKAVKDDAAPSIDAVVKFLESEDGAGYVYIENIDVKGFTIYADIRYMNGDDKYTADLEIFLDATHTEVALSFYEGGVYVGSYIVEGESSRIISLLEDVMALFNHNDGVGSVILEILTTDLRKDLRLMPHYRELFEGYAAKPEGAVTDARKQKGAMVDTCKKPHKAMSKKEVKDARHIHFVRDSRGRWVRK